jgi:uracil phosphoribosyltransferase
MAEPATSPIEGLTIVDHPIVQHRLTRLRDRTTAPAQFRAELRAISVLLGQAALADLPLQSVVIETPLAPLSAPLLANPPPVVAPILRAGLAMAEGVLDLLPEAAVAHLGFYRDPQTLAAVEYYFNAPADIARRRVLLVDPMLATGHSACAALDRLKAAGARDLRFVCLLAANDHGYIVPGLGDAGDRTFGTR